MDTQSPWPGLDGDDSDHGIDTWSDQKRRKCSMPEPACTGIDHGTGDGSSRRINRQHKNLRHVTIANQAKKQRRTMDRLGHRIPWGHAQAHRSPRELKRLTEGMIPMWTDLARASEEAHIKFTCAEWLDYPGSVDWSMHANKNERPIQSVGRGPVEVL